jgi:hypothetical protein
MSDRLKSLLLAFLISAVLWAALISGGMWAFDAVNGQLDTNSTAGVK